MEIYPILVSHARTMSWAAKRENGGHCVLPHKDIQCNHAVAVRRGHESVYQAAGRDF